MQKINKFLPHISCLVLDLVSPTVRSDLQADICVFKIHNENTRTMLEMCQHVTRVSIVDFEQANGTRKCGLGSKQASQSQQQSNTFKIC